MSDALLTKREQARELLKDVFSQRDRITVADAVALAAASGISRGTLTKARKDIGATEVHNGPYPGYWQRPEPSTPTMGDAP